MSWITIIWSIAAGICLALAGIQLLVWSRERTAWANLLFSIGAVAAAACALGEQVLMHAHTQAQYGEILYWMHLPAAVMVVTIVWFIRRYLQAGRNWLAWLITGIRALVLVLNFLMPSSLTFQEIFSLRQMLFLGETVSVPIGVMNPWRVSIQLSMVLLLVYVMDATIYGWKQGNRRRSIVIGGATLAAIVISAVSSQLMVRGILPGPFVSMAFLLIVLAMAFELSVDLIRASQLSRDLRETQERIRLAAEAANLGLWEWDIVRDEVWANDVSRTRLGAGESERIDFSRFLQSLHPDDRKQTRQAFKHFLNGGGEFKIEYRIISPDGTTLWTMTHGVVELGSNGQPLHIRGVSMDITKRKESELSLKESEARLRKAQRIAHVGNWELDLLTDTLSLSDEIFGIFEVDKAHFDASYEGFLTAVHPDDRDSVNTAYKRSLETREPCDITHRLLMPDGRIKSVHKRCETIYSPEGRPLRSLGTVQDITEREIVQKERVQLQNELAHLNRIMTLNELSASLAHEINQPLGAIMNNASTVRTMTSKFTKGNEELREILEDIINDAYRAGQIIRKIRGLSKKEEARYEPLNMNTLLKEVAELYRNTFLTDKISFRLDLHPDLPSIRGDRIRLEQVLMNLISNAMEAMEKSASSVLTVRSTMQSPNMITLSVSDSGFGFDEKIKSKVFEPFFTTKKDGLGIGLRICQSIIEEHDGRIWIENNPDAGASVLFSLKACQGESG